MRRRPDRWWVLVLHSCKQPDWGTCECPGQVGILRPRLPGCFSGAIYTATYTAPYTATYTATWLRDAGW